MNIPNVLSMLRIVLIPLFIILISYRHPALALAVFVLAAVTDGLDGCIARRFKMKTVLGSYLDPIADKLLLVSGFVTFALMGMLPRWLAILVVSRDVIITVGIMILRLNAYQPEIRPSIMSKCNTVMQMVTICLVLVVASGGSAGQLLPQLLAAACWITGMLTVLSGLHYITRGLRLINERNGA